MSSAYPYDEVELDNGWYGLVGQDINILIDPKQAALEVTDARNDAFHAELQRVAPQLLSDYKEGSMFSAFFLRLPRPTQGQYLFLKMNQSSLSPLFQKKLHASNLDLIHLKL